MPAQETVTDVTPSVADLLLARGDDDHPGLVMGDRSWSWREVVAAAAERAVLLRSLGRLDPPHVGVLLGNEPEFVFWLSAAALSGAVVVGINPTRRGEALAGDVRRTDCRVLVTDAEGAVLLEGLDTGVAPDLVLRVDTPAYTAAVADHAGVTAAAVVADAAPSAADLFLLLFTSGTTGAPKAVRCTQGRLASIALRSGRFYGYERSDVAYCAMPLFHGNALMVLWGPSLAVGATIALARRFSASGFVPDVRRYGVTTFTYVGKALAYVLATPPADDDADSTLRRGFGTEASVADLAAFERRFGCVLTEGYGSSEGGVAMNRAPDSPPGALGVPDADTAVVDPETLAECPPARFDAAGVLLNGSEAIGEIVNRSGAGGFEGYYADPGATAERIRERLVLDRGPRLPGRRGARLLRRTARRLDAGRFREHHGRTHRAGAGALPDGGRGGRLRGARSPLGRSGHGCDRAAARMRLRAGVLRGVPGGSGGSGHQMGALLSQDHLRPPADGERQGDQGAPPQRGVVAWGRPGPLPGRPAARIRPADQSPPERPRGRAPSSRPPGAGRGLSGTPRGDLFNRRRGPARAAVPRACWTRAPAGPPGRG